MILDALMLAALVIIHTMNLAYAIAIWRLSRAREAGDCQPD